MLEQLKTSSTIAYAEFMRSGYPIHISLQNFLNIFKPLNEKLSNICIKNFVTKCLLSMGLKLRDFRIGTEYIFLRSKRFDVVDQLFSSDLQTVQSSILNTKKFVLRSKWRTCISCILFLLKCK